MPSNKSYYTKISKIPPSDVSCWIDNFATPISGEEFDDIYSKIYASYIDLLSKTEQNSPIYWSLIINHKIIHLLSNQYFKYISLLALKTEGYEMINNDLSIDVAINEMRPLLSSLLPPKITFKRLLKEKLSGYLQNIKYSGFKNFFKYDSYFIGDINSPVAKTFFKGNKFSPNIINSLALFPRNGKASPQDQIDIKTFICNFISKLTQIDKHAEHFFNNEKFQTDLASILNRTVINFKSIRDSPFRYPLITDSMYNRNTRVLLSAWASKELSTIAFTHGNLCFHLNNTSIDALALAPIRFYVLDSKGEKLAFEKYFLKKSAFSKFHGFMEHNNEIVRNVFIANQKLPRIKKIKNVMIIGFPMDYLYYYKGINHSTLNYAHLILRLCKILKNADYRVLYKAHPDTLVETKSFFDNYVDEVISENFELVYKKADCLLYPVYGTTTFAIGLASCLPVVYLDNTDLPGLIPEIQKELNKCAMPLKVHGDHKGIILFDDDELLNAIDASIQLNDYSVIDKYV